MGKYSIVLFDLDGTLTDPGEGITNSVAYSLEKMGFEVPEKEELYKFIGPPLPESFRVYYSMSEEQSMTAVLYFREYYSKTGINENYIYDGIIELLEYIKERNIKIALASSKPEKFAEQVLKNFDIYKYFDFIGAASTDEIRSTKEEVIQYVVDNFPIEDNKKVLMIGDRIYDIKGANKFGFDSCGVLYGYGNREEFETGGATYIADTPESIRKIVE